MHASGESSANVFSGNFEGNEALNGGAAYVGDDAALSVEGGVFTGNEARNGGGVFCKEDGGNIEVNGFSTFFSRSFLVRVLVRKVGFKC